MTSDMFPADYKAKMIRSYPVIAQMDADEAWNASEQERDEAFQRILDNRNLRRTHELYLAGIGGGPSAFRGEGDFTEFGGDGDG